MKILCVFIDAMRADFLSCYGYPYDRLTKNIDEQAGKGTMFLQAHGGSNTPHGTAMFLLGKRGYKTQHHCDDPERNWKLDIAGEEDSLLRFFPNHGLMTPNLITRNFFLEAGGREEYCVAATVPGRELTDRAIKQSRRLDKESDDWLQVVWYFDVHQYKQLNIYDYPYMRTTDSPGTRSMERVADDVHYCSEEYFKVLRHVQYMCATKYVDEEVGRLVNEIPYDWLVITADHGEFLDPYYSHSLGWQYEVTHIPLIIVGPDTSRSVVAERAHLNDLSATLLDLHVDAIPDSWDGQSLLGYVRRQD